MKKRNLTKEKICTAAIHLVESEGVERLSMRKLADKLNIEAASLYNHIANKAELFDLIQEHLYSQMSIQISTKNWQKYLAELATITRYNLLKIPRLALLFATRPTITASALKQMNATIDILINAGFKPSVVASIYTNLHVFVLGHVLAEVGLVPGEKDTRHEPAREKINLHAYPALRKIYSNKTGSDFEKGFKMGIQNMINGLALMHEKF